MIYLFVYLLFHTLFNIVNTIAHLELVVNSDPQEQTWATGINSFLQAMVLGRKWYDPCTAQAKQLLFLVSRGFFWLLLQLWYLEAGCSVLCVCRRSCWRSTTSQLILSAALRLHGRRVYSQNAKRKCRTHMQNCNDCYGSIALVPGRRNWTCTLRSRGPDMFRDACNPEALQSSEKSTLILFGTANLLSSLA